MTVTVTCTVTSPTGSEIAAVTYSLMATIVSTDGCGFGMTISNPGPIPFDFDPATIDLVVRLLRSLPGRGADARAVLNGLFGTSVTTRVP